MTQLASMFERDLRNEVRHGLAYGLLTEVCRRIQWQIWMEKLMRSLISLWAGTKSLHRTQTIARY